MTIKTMDINESTNKVLSFPNGRGYKTELRYENSRKFDFYITALDQECINALNLREAIGVLENNFCEGKYGRILSIYDYWGYNHIFNLCASMTRTKFAAMKIAAEESDIDNPLADEIVGYMFDVISVHSLGFFAKDFEEAEAKLNHTLSSRKYELLNISPRVSLEW